MVNVVWLKLEVQWYRIPNETENKCDNRVSIVSGTENSSNIFQVDLFTWHGIHTACVIMSINAITNTRVASWCQTPIAENEFYIQNSNAFLVCITYNEGSERYNCKRIRLNLEEFENIKIFTSTLVLASLRSIVSSSWKSSMQCESFQSFSMSPSWFSVYVSWIHKTSASFKFCTLTLFGMFLTPSVPLSHLWSCSFSIYIYILRFSL